MVVVVVVTVVDVAVVCPGIVVPGVEVGVVCGAAVVVVDVRLALTRSICAAILFLQFDSGLLQSMNGGVGWYTI